MHDEGTPHGPAQAQAALQCAASGRVSVRWLAAEPARLRSRGASGKRQFTGGARLFQLCEIATTKDGSRTGCIAGISAATGNGNTIGAGMR